MALEDQTAVPFTAVSKMCIIVNRWSLLYGLLAAIVVQLPSETVSGAAGVPEDSAPSASHVEMKDGFLLLRQGGLHLPVSLDCLTFVTDRGTLGIDMKPTHVSGEITDRAAVAGDVPADYLWLTPVNSS